MRPRIGAGSRKGIQVEGATCTKAWGGGDGRWDVRQPRSCVVCLELRRLLLGADALPTTALGPACAPASCSDGGHRSQLPEGRVVPGRPRHQPPPPARHRQPPQQAPTPRSWPPPPSVSPFPAPPSLLLQLFLWQSPVPFSPREQRGQDRPGVSLGASTGRGCSGSAALWGLWGAHERGVNCFLGQTAPGKEQCDFEKEVGEHGFPAQPRVT